MLRQLSVLVLSLVLLVPSTSHGGPPGPSNYDECIIDSMKGVSSDVAARAIIESCRNLFPDSDGDIAPSTAPAPATEPVPAVPAVRDVETAAATSGSAASADPAPLDTTGARRLTADELALLSTRVKVFGSAYRVTIDNGSPNLTLTEVTIAVWDESDPAARRKEYSEAVEIAPRTSAEVKYTVHYRGDETSWRWGVVAARGVE